MTRLIQKAGVKCHTEKREKRDGWVNRLVSFLQDNSTRTANFRNWYCFVFTYKPN